VSLDENDRKRMAAFFGLSEEETAEKYWKIQNTHIQMKTVDGHCIFYKDGCSVHTARPWRCAQWPLPPALFVDPVNLAIIRDSCPGVDRELSYEEFCRLLKAICGNV